MLFSDATRIIIHPGSEAFRPFAEAVVAGEVGEGRVIYRSRNRNTISVHQVNGQEINLKRYKIPVSYNCIIYSFFRKSKARRAYEHALLLTARGIETARPVAYMEKRRHGLLRESFLLTGQCPYTRNMYEFGHSSPEGREDILRAFGRFTARLHQAGILHQDYSPGNILFDKVDGEWHFCIVDINRMKFKKFSLDSGCRNFRRLWGGQDTFRYMAEGYAEAMHHDLAECTERMLRYREKFWKKRNKRHPKEAQPL